MGVVRFDTSKNKFLAVGDDYAIKVWDMDNANLLTTIDAEGGLPVSSFEVFINNAYLCSIEVMAVFIHQFFPVLGKSFHSLQQGGLFIGCFCK